MMWQLLVLKKSMHGEKDNLTSHEIPKSLKSKSNPYGNTFCMWILEHKHSGRKFNSFKSSDPLRQYNKMGQNSSTSMHNNKLGGAKIKESDCLESFLFSPVQKMSVSLPLLTEIINASCYTAHKISRLPANESISIIYLMSYNI